jgi:hypothetical protein
MESQAERLRQIYYKESFCLQRRVGTTRKGFEALRGACENGSCACRAGRRSDALDRQGDGRCCPACRCARCSESGAGAPPAAARVRRFKPVQDLADSGPLFKPGAASRPHPGKPADEEGPGGNGTPNSLQVVDN